MKGKAKIKSSAIKDGFGLVDPVTFEVLRHRLWAINDEQAAIAARISGSPVVYETFDYNIAILTAEGKGVFTGVYIAHHAIPLEQVVRSVREKYGDNIHPGDMFYTNDPWCGALHANDGALASPVFWKGEIVCWSAIVMHDVDVGGPVAGSFVVGARESFGEAPLYPPFKLVEKDKLREDLYEILIRNSRSPQVNYLNTKARISSQLTTRQHMHELIREYGRDTFVNVLDQIINHTKIVLEDRLSKIPDGEWYEHGYLDHDGITNHIYRIQVKLIKKGARLTFDFTGTDQQAAGSVNCTKSGLTGGVIGPLMAMLCYDLPWSTGALNSIVDIKAEEGTINNAKFPAAVSMASIQAAFATQNVASNAIAKMLCCSNESKEEAQACWTPYWNGPGTSGFNQRGQYFVQAMAEGGGGGGGARTFRDGINCGGMIHSLAAAIPNVETNEHLQPVIELYRRYCPDTCGHGMYRGGAGLEYAFGLLGTDKPINIRMVVCGVSVPGAQGLFGGYPPSINTNVVLRKTNLEQLLNRGQIPGSWEEINAAEREFLPAKILTQMMPGDVHIGIVSGGSGYGDPLKRDPQMVQRDVEDGLVTAEIAVKIYGVIPGNKGSFDESGTLKFRKKLQVERLKESKVSHIYKQAEIGKAGKNANTYKYLHPVSDFMEMRIENSGTGRKVLFCSNCGAALCPAESNIRQYLAKSAPISIKSYSPVNKLSGESDSYIVHYHCPACGSLLSTDAVTGEDKEKIWPDFILGK